MERKGVQGTTGGTQGILGLNLLGIVGRGFGTLQVNGGTSGNKSQVCTYVFVYYPSQMEIN